MTKKHYHIDHCLGPCSACSQHSSSVHGKAAQATTVLTIVTNHNVSLRPPELPSNGFPVEDITVVRNDLRLLDILQMVHGDFIDTLFQSETFGTAKLPTVHDIVQGCSHPHSIPRCSWWDICRCALHVPTTDSEQGSVPGESPRLQPWKRRQ